MRGIMRPRDWACDSHEMSLTDLTVEGDKKVAVFACQLILKVNISHEIPSYCVCLVVFFRLSRQFPMCSSFFNNSVNYIWSMAVKLKANHKQINQQNGQLGGKSWQRSCICLTAKMNSFRFEDKIWLLFFSRIPKK